MLFPLLRDCRSVLDNLYDGVDGTYDGVASIFDTSYESCLSIQGPDALGRVQELYDSGVCPADVLNGVGETDVIATCEDKNTQCDMLLTSGIACSILLGSCDESCNFCGAGHRRALAKKRNLQAQNLNCDVASVESDIANINVVCCDTDGACAAGVPTTCDAKCAVFFVDFYDRCQDYINLNNNPTAITALGQLATTCEGNLPTEELLLAAAQCSGWDSNTHHFVPGSGAGGGGGAFANRIYAVGGYDGSHYLSSAEVYDPDQDTWNSIASMNSPRYHLGVCAL